MLGGGSEPPRIGTKIQLRGILLLPNKPVSSVAVIQEVAALLRMNHAGLQPVNATPRRGRGGVNESIRRWCGWFQTAGGDREPWLCTDTL